MGAIRLSHSVEGPRISRIRRVYCPQIRPQTTLTVTGPEVHHVRNVLRLSPGSHVELFDGAGHHAAATIDRVDRDRLHVTAGSLQTDPFVPFSISLACAIPKHAACECLVRYGTELGVTAFQPILCQRSVVTRVNVDKWRRWAVEACKQSGRNTLPRIDEPVGLEDAVSRSGQMDLKLYGACEASARLSPADWACAIVYIGPEGGFTNNEQQLLRDHRVVPFCLGPYVLRVETAAVAVIAALSYR